MKPKPVEKIEEPLPPIFKNKEIKDSKLPIKKLYFNSLRFLDQKDRGVRFLDQKDRGGGKKETQIISSNKRKEAETQSILEIFPHYQNLEFDLPNISKQFMRK